MDFNIGRYIQLLEKNDTLKNQNISLVYENPAQYKELLNYQIIVEGNIYYQNKSNYIALIKKFLNTSLGQDETKLFVLQLRDIFQQDNKKLLEIENQIIQNRTTKLDELEIHPNSVLFSNLTFQLVDSGENLTFDPSNAYGIRLSQFLGIIKKNYLEMKKL